MPALGAVGLWRLVVLLLLGVASVAAVLSFRQRRTGALALGLGVALGLGLATAPGPAAAWRHSPIGAGRANLTGLDPVATQDALRQVRRATLWEVDGVESALALQTSPATPSSSTARWTAMSSGMLPPTCGWACCPPCCIPRPAACSSSAWASGRAAGWAAAADEVEHIDVIELEPAIVDVARACALSNHGALDNPKIQVHMGDAREWLMASPQRYDIIVSGQPNPYRAGIASLFNEEFYAASRQRWSPGALLAMGPGL